jgi:Zn-dependent metalloprotease
MKKSLRLPFGFSVCVAVCLLNLDARAMPSPTRPVPSSGAGANPTAAPGASVQWLNPVNQGIGAWIGQQVQARQAANRQKQSAHRHQQTKQLTQQLSITTGASVTFRPNGTPSEIKGSFLQPAFIGPALPGSDHLIETARAFLQANKSLLMLNDPDSELVLRAGQTDELGRHHLRFRQEHKGIPVWPAELIVHMTSAGSLDLLDGAFVPSPQVETTPRLLATDALEKARQRLNAPYAAAAAAPELIIYGPLENSSRLAWKFDLVASVANAWRCVVDATDGALLARFSLVTEGAVNGSGVDGLGQNRTLHVWQQGSIFYLEDTSKQMFNSASTPPNPDKTDGAIFIWDSQNTPPTSNPTATTNFLGNPILSTSSSATSWVPDAVGAAFGLSQTYDYYLARHNRNSLDGAGGSINGFVRVGINWRNAFWAEAYKIMVFGDTLPTGLDACAHELTHGVIFSTGDGGILNYHDQPGAINEALADIFGENVEAFTKGTNDWIIGEDTVLGSLRDMASPGNLKFGNNPYPSKMSQFYQLGPDQDHGGVHENSSIINHCYYLLAAGLDGAIGIPQAEKIFYRAMTLHLAKESQFIDCRHACVSAAEEIYGSNSVQAQKTAEAFDAVEIVDAPSTPEPPTIPVVQAPDSTLFLRWDPFAGITGQYDLFRRETAQGDGASGTFIPTINYLAPERISVSGDGSFAFYVTVDNDYGAVNTDGSSPLLGGSPGEIHSLAMTPDSTQFAYVPLDSQGNPLNYIGLIDLTKQTSRVVKLYGLDSEGNRTDIIKYADVLDFTSDGRTLVYDAYSEFTTSSGNLFSGWTIYSMDMATTNISALISLNGDFNFGNPSIGKADNSLVTFEVINKTNGISSLVAVDLFSGKGSEVGQLTTAGALGKPSFTGDDHTIIYSAPNPSANSLYSLVSQPIGPDGITATGSPSLWLSDADFGAIYRRGTFTGSNSVPIVTLSSPGPGQIFAAGADITLKATANDPDGNIAKVEFYQGSTKLGEASTAPYNFTWSQVAAGTYHLLARAIDGLGASADSTQIAIVVGSLPQLSNAQVVAGHFQFTVRSDPGSVFQVERANDLENWSQVGSLTNDTGTATFQDPSSLTSVSGFYRLRQQ